MPDGQREHPTLVRNDTIRTFLIPISIIVSILIAGWQVSSELEAQRRQAAVELEAQKIQAEADFELEAARVVMASTSCKSALTKAKVLKRLFPDRLDDSFVDEWQVSTGPKDETGCPSTFGTAEAFRAAFASSTEDEKNASALAEALLELDRRDREARARNSGQSGS